MDAIFIVNKALYSENSFEQLRIVIKGLIDSGYNRDKLIEELTNLMLDLRESGKENEEDQILDMISFLEGWCSPHMLF